MAVRRCLLRTFDLESTSTTFPTADTWQGANNQQNQRHSSLGSPQYHILHRSRRHSFSSWYRKPYQNTGILLFACRSHHILSWHPFHNPTCTSTTRSITRNTVVQTPDMTNRNIDSSQAVSLKDILIVCNKRIMLVYRDTVLMREIASCFCKQTVLWKKQKQEELHGRTLLRVRPDECFSRHRALWQVIWCSRAPKLPRSSQELPVFLSGWRRKVMDSGDMEMGWNHV